MGAVRELLAFLISLLVIAPGINSFNLLIKSARVIFAPDHEPSSLFGYSVTLQTNPARLLIGAPKARSQLQAHYYINRPGCLYSCVLSSGKCTEILLDKEGEVRHTTPKESQYWDLKENAWIGGAVDTSADSQQFIVCGSRWKNQYQEGFYLMNGVCYFSNNSLSVSSIDPTPQKMLPLIQKSRQQGFDDVKNETLFYYAYGQAGFSAHVSKSNEIILGAPGLMQWRGSVIRYKRLPPTEDFFVPNLLNIINEYEYFGYAVESGKFLKADEPNFYVASAPRANYRGAVYIFTFTNNEHSPIKIHIQVNGMQMGEYFGASLATADVDNDGFDELLVGAPLHTIEKQGTDSSEEGVVYIYNFNKVNKDPIIIKGESKFQSRFGSAIVNLGDLNQDGFKDIAIGAPYEGEQNGDNRGAVYIYLGSTNGLRFPHAQKILAQALPHGPLQGFGVSLSRGLDVDNNGYPDLAIGAHDSANAVIIMSQPVVSINVNITSSVDVILQNTSQIALKACTEFTGKFVPNTLDLQAVITVDKKHRRGYFENGKNTETRKLVLQVHKEHCFEVPVKLQPLSTWHISSLYAVFAINFSIDTTLIKDAVPDPYLPKISNLILPIMSNCNGQICIPKWIPKISFINEQDPFVLGLKDSISVRIDVTNQGDNAHIQKLLIVLPSNVTLKTIPTFCDKFISDGTNETGDVICFTGASLHSFQKRSVVLNLALTELDPKTDQLKINVSVYSYNSEDIAKTSASMSVIRKNILGIRARATPEIVLLQNLPQLFLLTHTYQIYCAGYTPIDSVKIKITIPFEARHKNKWFHLLNDTSPQIGIEPASVQCHSEQGRAKRNNLPSQHLFCNSDSLKCLTIICDGGPLGVKSGEIRIHLKPILLVDSFDLILGKAENLFFHTTVEVWPSEEENNAITKMLDTRFDGQIQQKADPFLWLYIFAAVIIAVVLLLIIAYVLWKWRFFDRKRADTKVHQNEDESYLDANQDLDNDE